ncbi:hypothetical protein T484DRAFT_1633462, partial [Baffinella frigidus]
NPQPETLNPQPQTLNPQPQKPNPKPQTTNHKPQTTNHEPQTTTPSPKPQTPKQDLNGKCSDKELKTQPWYNGNVGNISLLKCYEVHPSTSKPYFKGHDLLVRAL